MKLTLKLLVTTTALAAAGLTHAHDPSTSQDSSTNSPMEMPMMKEGMMEMEEGMMHKTEPRPSAGDKTKKPKHNHRKFKGLTSAPPSDDSSAEDTDKPEGHNHRKKHK